MAHGEQRRHHPTGQRPEAGKTGADDCHVDFDHQPEVVDAEPVQRVLVSGVVERDVQTEEADSEDAAVVSTTRSTNNGRRIHVQASRSQNASDGCLLRKAGSKRSKNPNRKREDDGVGCHIERDECLVPDVDVDALLGSFVGCIPEAVDGSACVDERESAGNGIPDDNGHDEIHGNLEIPAHREAKVKAEDGGFGKERDEVVEDGDRKGTQLHPESVNTQRNSLRQCTHENVDAHRRADVFNLPVVQAETAFLDILRLLVLVPCQPRDELRTKVLGDGVADGADQRGKDEPWVSISIVQQRLGRV